MKNNKAFTIVELLMVIVLLAIVALIAVPMIQNLVMDAKTRTNKLNTQKYIETVQLTLEKRQLKERQPITRCTIYDNKGNLKCNDNQIVELSFKGSIPSSGTLNIEEVKVKEAVITFERGMNSIYYDSKTSSYEEIEDSRNNYIITYDTDGGSVNEFYKVVKNGEEYGTLPTPTKEGYTFLGWTNGVNLIPDLSLWTLRNGATYDASTKSIYLPNIGSEAISPYIYLGDTNINKLKYFKYYAEYKSDLESSNFEVGTKYYDRNKVFYSRNGHATEITTDWKLNSSINTTYLSKGSCGYVTINYLRSDAYSKNPYYIRNVDLRVQTEDIDKYEPYFTTSDVIVSLKKDHTLKAIWK